MKIKMRKRIKIPVRGTIDTTMRAIIDAHERRHRGVTTEQLGELMLKTVCQMTPRERSILRNRLWQDAFGKPYPPSKKAN